MKSQEEHLRCAEAAKIDVVEALRVNYRGSSHCYYYRIRHENDYNTY